MRESARIDDGTRRVAVLLQEIDERTLVIRLVRDEVPTSLPRDLATARLDLREGRGPVQLRIAHAEQVQVGPVHEQDLHAARSTIRDAARRNGSPTPVTSLKRPIRRGRIQRS